MSRWPRRDGSSACERRSRRALEVGCGKSRAGYPSSRGSKNSTKPFPATKPNGSVGFADFADLYDAAGPKTDAMKALVGGYWLQVCQGNASFPSRDVNELLKNHGHPVSNITRAFDLLRDSKPSYAAQIEKSGKTQQARKKMKLTTAGIRQVEAMTKGDGGEKDG